MLRVLCAWCTTTIQPGDSPDAEASHGICFDCVKTMGLFPTEDVLSLSADMLDKLPMGIIELDGDGIVRRYNTTEASAAGLDPARVIGRHFFTEVAPCTTVNTFRGRFEQMVQSTAPCREELDFLFRFASGDRYAHLVFVWAPERNRLMILANLMGPTDEHARRDEAAQSTR